MFSSHANLIYYFATHILLRCAGTSTEPVTTPPSVEGENPQDEIILCPENFISVPEEEICYMLTHPQPFPPKCPYPNYFIPDLNITQPVWAPLRRNRNGFGPFEWTIQGYPFMDEPVPSYKATTRDIEGKDCMTKENQEYAPARCSDHNPAVCGYSVAHKDLSKYCTNHYSDDYNSCVGDGLNIEDNRCYCERIQDGRRDSFCEKLAEPKTAFQNFLLLRRMYPKSDACWFGLRREGNATTWDSGEELAYVNWTSNVNYSNSLGAVQFVGEPGWLLAEDDLAITCAVCELRNTYKNVSIRLKHRPFGSFVEMRVKNARGLSDHFGGWYALHCYAGYSFAHRFEVRRFDYLPAGDFINYVPIAREFPVYYWCEGFEHPDFSQVNSNKILVSKIQGQYEYALMVTARTGKNRDPYLDLLPNKITLRLMENLEVSEQDSFRLMEVRYSQHDSTAEMIFHLTTCGDTNDFDELSKLLGSFKLAEDPSVVNITYLRRSGVCLPSQTYENVLNWPRTPAGHTVMPMELCLQKEGKPVVRKCEGDFLHGSFWGDVVGSCEDVHVAERTKALYSLLQGQSQNVSEELLGITQDASNVSMVDVHLIAELLERVALYGGGGDVVKIISNVMEFDQDVLVESQMLLNSTDRILDVLDDVVTELSDVTVEIISSQNLLVVINDVVATKVTGVAFIKGEDGNYTFIPLYSEEFPEEFDVAVRLPSNLTELQECLYPLPIKLAVTFFSNNKFFNHTVNSSLNNEVVSVVIPHLYCIFSNSITVAFNPPSHANETKCAYWKYGLDEDKTNLAGRWVEEGSPVDNTCRFDHLTHFGLLIIGCRAEAPSVHRLVLAILSGIGFFSSLVSLLFIFFLASISRKCRSSYCNQVILNFSAAIILEIVFLIASIHINRDPWCIAMGACLHYTLIAQFCWMLVVFTLQYQKYVAVSLKIPHLVGKACAMSWGFPFLPVIALLAVSRGSYRKNAYGFCYPSGFYFYFGVVLPIAVTLLLNSFVSARVIVHNLRKKEHRWDRRREVYFAVFIFVVLVMSWISGLIMNFGGSNAVSYVFCISTAFEGVFLFIFFVIVNQDNKFLADF